MEHYKISKLLNDSTVSKFVTKKWIEINNLLSGQYSASKNIRFKTSILRSNIFDYSDVYIAVKERISSGGFFLLYIYIYVYISSMIYKHIHRTLT